MTTRSALKGHYKCRFEQPHHITNACSCQGFPHGGFIRKGEAMHSTKTLRAGAIPADHHFCQPDQHGPECSAAPVAAGSAQVTSTEEHLDQSADLLYKICGDGGLRPPDAPFVTGFAAPEPVGSVLVMTVHSITGNFPPEWLSLVWSELNIDPHVAGRPFRYRTTFIVTLSGQRERSEFPAQSLTTRVRTAVQHLHDLWVSAGFCLIANGATDATLAVFSAYRAAQAQTLISGSPMLDRTSSDRRSRMLARRVHLRRKRQPPYSRTNNRG
jgi:hypothetical protein